MLKILILFTVWNIYAFADITKEEADKFLEGSRAEQLIEPRMPSQNSNLLTKICSIKLDRLSKTLIKQYKNFLSSPKYIDDFLKVIMTIDRKDYTEIKAFYDTALGKKYGASFGVLKSDDALKKILLFYIKKIKSPPSKQQALLNKRKRELIREINRVTNIDKYRLDLIGHFIEGAKEQKIALFYNELKTLLKVSKGSESLVILDEYIYRDFTEVELLEILEYAKEYGKIEMELVLTAISQYLNNTEKDIIGWIKESEIKSCHYKGIDIKKILLGK